MVQKYQNEIAPIFYYGISTKNIEKDLKIPILQPPDWKHPYWMSLYDAIWERSYKVKDITCDLFHDNSLKAVLENNVDNL